MCASRMCLFIIKEVSKLISSSERKRMRYAKSNNIGRWVAGSKNMLIPDTNIKLYRETTARSTEKITKTRSGRWAVHFLIYLVTIGIINCIAVCVVFLYIGKAERIAQQWFSIPSIIFLRK